MSTFSFETSMNFADYTSVLLPTYIINSKHWHAMEYFFQSVDGISGSIKIVYFSNSSNTRKYYQENILEAT